MALVRIYQPAKNAMQSGRANARKWVLEFVSDAPRANDPLMGWVGSSDTTRQVRLRFATRDDAVRFARRHDHTVELAEPHARRVKPKNYADNFRYDNPVPSSG